MTVTREGAFIRSALEVVDETEIYTGSENRLTMNQTYTREFQCIYQLQRYPFDSQVNLVLNKLASLEATLVRNSDLASV